LINCEIGNLLIGVYDCWCVKLVYILINSTFFSSSKKKRRWLSVDFVSRGFEKFINFRGVMIDFVELISYLAW